LLSLRCHRGQFAVGRVDDEPRAAAIALQMFVPMRGTSAGFRATNAPRDLGGQCLALLGQGSEIGFTEVLK
jgi:hypothetical protein